MSIDNRTLASYMPVIDNGARTGYEVTVYAGGLNIGPLKILGKEKVLCVDEKNVVRGWYLKGARGYSSDFELWGLAEESGIGSMKGELGIGKRVEFVYKDGGAEAGHVTDMVPVSIADMVGNPIIVGFDRPAYKDDFLDPDEENNK